MNASGKSDPRILVADDQPDILEALRLLLKAEGYQGDLVSTPAAIMQSVREREYDAVLMDLNFTRDTTSGHEGLDLLDRLQATDNTLPVVVMTAWGSIELAVDAMRRGARDFVQKPWENARLLSILRSQIELSRALRRGRRLEAENELLRGESGPALIGESTAMRRVLEMIARIGPADANVLITGENGVGKGVVARALHGVSRRASASFVVVNTGGLPEGVFESELFGHVKGAFTDARSDRVGRFDLADGGTLFLDEVANMSQGQQAKLLRVVETGEFERVGASRTSHADVRIISATNADLQLAVASGQFRQDLLFRLNTVEIRLPPLRDRRDDIPLLAHFFLQRHAQHYRRPVTAFDDAAMNALLDHQWPGNVRELDHVVERSVLMARDHAIRVADLGLQPPGVASALVEQMSLEDMEKALVREALHLHDGNVTEAASALGLSRSALYRRLKKYGL